MKQLYLSATDKKLAGVCGGIGEFFGIDSTLIRLSWIIASALTGIAPGIIAYIVAALVIPHKQSGSSSSPPSDTTAAG